jgi:hypothetical protein
LKVMRKGRPVTVDVTSDGEGLVSHAGTALLAQVADKLAVTKALSLRLAGLKQRRRGHDPGRVIRDLAVMLADGGECVSDLGAVRDQEALFGPVASDSTAFGWSTGLPRAPVQARARIRGRSRGALPRPPSHVWDAHGSRGRADANAPGMDGPP